MGVINVLDKHVAELIAAGEVVERPASVIKELVENAIDAKARHITVEIKNGGTTFMRVTDDGCGIMRDDVKKAFLRHATSKVSQEDDLDCIATLGFRGEALASISAVSKLQLITRNENEELGSNYVIEGGEEVSLDDAGCPVGTTFVIRDLFYNIPAREKLKKKDMALQSFGDGKLISAIYAVYGREFAGSLILVDYQLDAISVKGYITKPVHSRANRNMQNFFINGRYVKSRTAMAALEEAFKGSIMVGKFPSCVLEITLPYEMIDVNVHPAKIEVRFINERPVFDAVYHAVKSSLLRDDSKKQAVFKKDTAFNDIRKFSPFKNAQVVLKETEVPRIEKAKQPSDDFDLFSELDLETTEKSTEKKAPLVSEKPSLSNENQPFNIYSSRAVQAQKDKQRFAEQAKKKTPGEPNEIISPDLPKPDIPEQQPSSNVTVTQNQNSQPSLIESADELRYIGELFQTYIIVEKNQKEMMLIDKHAAHERIIFERLKAEKAGSCAQLLLQPLTVTLGKTEYDAAISHLDLFAECSFEVEDFGNSTVLVRSAPQYIDASEIEDCIVEMADHISVGNNDIFSEKMDWFYHNVACRSAIKAGNQNSAQELIDIVKVLEEHPEIRYCPHGRPICIMMKKSEIERQFGRA